MHIASIVRTLAFVSMFAVVPACGREPESAPKPALVEKSAGEPTPRAPKQGPATPATAAAPATPAATPATPAAPGTVMPSKLAACTDVELADLGVQLDAGARAAILELGGALASNDPARLAPLLAARVKIDKASLTAADAMSRISKIGPQAVIGFSPGEHFDSAANRTRCAWTLSVAPGEAALEVFTGSGYGNTRVARLAKIDGAWKVSAFESVDYGEP